MNYVKLNFTGNSYSYIDSSSTEMFVLGLFLSSNVGCYWPSFRDFAFSDSEESTSGNSIYLEKEENHIFLSDLYSEKNQPERLKMSINQYVTLFDDWEEQVCKQKPKTVIIRHDHDQFIIETSNE